MRCLFCGDLSDSTICPKCDKKTKTDSTVLDNNDTKSLPTLIRKPCRKFTTGELRYLKSGNTLTLQQKWSCDCDSHVHVKWKDVPIVIETPTERMNQYGISR